jgi:hypothetical protein
MNGSETQAAGTERTITLNRGQTFAARNERMNNASSVSLAGSYVSADKPVAVTMVHDLYGSGDIVGDQLVPVPNLGTTYVAARGFISIGDRINVVAVENNTVVTFTPASGSVTTQTLAKGQPYTYTLATASDIVTVEATQPIYAFQQSGQREYGGAQLPSMYAINSNTVSLYKTSGNSISLFALVRSGSEGRFLIDGVASSILQASDFRDITGLSGWKYARKQNVSLSDGVHKFVNTGGNFSLGYISNTGGGTSFGYLSGYGQVEFPDTTWRCTPTSSVTLSGGYAKSWY